MNYIAFTTVFVSDQDRALEFYQSLGFSKGSDRRFDDYRWVTVAPPGAQTGIALHRDAGRAGQSTFVYHTDDIAALYDQWCERGISFNEPPTPQMWGVQALLDDPDGNAIVVVQPEE